MNRRQEDQVIVRKRGGWWVWWCDVAHCAAPEHLRHGRWFHTWEAAHLPADGHARVWHQTRHLGHDLDFQ